MEKVFLNTDTPYIQDLHFYRYLIQLLASYVSEEGYMSQVKPGQSKLSIVQRRRLTHQYINAMLACGFPQNTPSLRSALQWLLESKTGPTRYDQEIENYLVLDKIEAAIKMGEVNGRFCEKAISLLLKNRYGPIKYDIPGENRGAFTSLWCAKILSHFPERKDCLDAARDTVRFIVNQADDFMKGSRDLSFLISLYWGLFPDEKTEKSPIERMLTTVYQDYHDGVFDVKNTVIERLKQLLEEGITPYSVAGIEREVHWSIVSTTYVVENLMDLHPRNSNLDQVLQLAVSNIYKMFSGTVDQIPVIFSEPYLQIMLASRLLSVFCKFTGADIAKLILPNYLEEIVRNETQRSDSLGEKQHLQTVFKEWLRIEWDEKEQEYLNGGLSGAKVVRVPPRIKIPSEEYEDGYKSIEIPDIKSVIIKYGLETDLEQERNNYASIPEDCRWMVASIPASSHQRVVRGDALEYLVVEDLIGYKTIQEILPNCTPEYRKYLIQRLIEFLQSFYNKIPSNTLSSSGICRGLYITPINKYLDIIHDFKARIVGLSEEDKNALKNIVDITFDLPILESFEPTVMHGDLNIRNIMTRGKQTITTEPRFRLIDINKFSRTGDVAYDVGELLVDLEQASKQKDFVEIGKETNEAIEIAFQKFMTERHDTTYGTRFVLSKARSLLKLTQLRASLSLPWLGKNPISDQQARKIYEDEILPNLTQVYSLIATVSSSTAH
jgi:hypothetical protein